MPATRKRSLNILIVALLSVAWNAAEVTAATYYAATSGNDGNPGSLAQPFRTIRKGLSVLRAGDTLYLRAGTYAETINANDYLIPAGTSWTNPVTVAAYPGETVIISGRGINITNKVSVQYLIFRGDPGSYNLILDGSGLPMSNYLTIINAEGSNIRDTNIRFQNMEMRNSNNAQGVFIFANRVEILNSKIHDVRATTAAIANGDIQCLYMQGAYAILDGNDIYNCPAYGIQFYNGYDRTKAHSNIIRNNRIHNTSAGPYGGGGGGLIVGSGGNNLVYNNILFNNPGGGIHVGYGGSGNQIYNNTIYNSGEIGFALDINNVSNTLVKNNILYQNRYDIKDGTGSTTYQRNLCGTVSAKCEFAGDPRFVNPAGGDFRLQNTSPVIDRGVTVNVVPVDFQLTVRPRGAAYDLGAFEFGSAPGGPVVPKNVRINP